MNKIVVNCNCKPLAQKEAELTEAQKRIDYLLGLTVRLHEERKNRGKEVAALANMALQPANDTINKLNAELEMAKDRLAIMDGHMEQAKKRIDELKAVKRADDTEIFRVTTLLSLARGEVSAFSRVLGKKDAEIYRLSKALELKGGDMDSIYGKLEERIVQLNRESAEARKELADARKALGQKDEAIGAYHKELEGTRQVAVELKNILREKDAQIAGMQSAAVEAAADIEESLDELDAALLTSEECKFLLRLLMGCSPRGHLEAVRGLNPENAPGGVSVFVSAIAEKLKANIEPAKEDTLAGECPDPECPCHGQDGNIAGQASATPQ